METQRLRVMLLISNLQIGGAQEVVRTLAKEFAAAGCSPVVCAFEDGDLRSEIERLGIPVEILPARRYSITNFPFFIQDMLRIRGALDRLIEKYGINVIQTQLLRSLDFLVLTLRYRKKLLVFWTFHNVRFILREEHLSQSRWLLGPKRWVYRLLYRFSARWVNGYIAVSDDVKNAILQYTGPLRGKLSVILNGVDVDRYQMPVDRTRIRQALGLADNARLAAVVATFKEQKGHRFLIDTLPEILLRFPDLHILFIGEGELGNQLKAQTASLGLQKHIHFLGFRNDIPELLRASDYFVLPSLWEGLPMALIEAMASGLPVIATEVSGTREVMIGGQTGLLVPPGDAGRLKDALICLLSDPAQARSMGAAGHRRIVEQFSAAKQAHEHLALYLKQWETIL